MSSETRYLAVMLDAPLMSWGHSSRFTRRTTALHPTRSALTGMICAALGVAKGSDAEKAWLDQLEKVQMTVLAIPRQKPLGGEELPIRRMEDYHVTGGGYDKKTQAGSIPRKASGGPCDNPTLSWRQYLLDARFGVILAGSGETLREVAKALADPRWGVWFGRKNCIPAAPVLRGVVVDTLDEGLAHLGLVGKQLTEFAHVADAESFADGTDTLMDAPVNYMTRQFKPRRIAKHVRAER
jgi:CRISPR system Cascade subunit CasD